MEDKEKGEEEEDFSAKVHEVKKQKMPIKQKIKTVMSDLYQAILINKEILIVMAMSLCQKFANSALMQYEGLVQTDAYGTTPEEQNEAKARMSLISMIQTGVNIPTSVL